MWLEKYSFVLARSEDYARLNGASGGPGDEATIRQEY